MRLLFLVPVYNHPLKIGRVAANCLAHGFDVLLVDDGSNEETKRAIAEAAKRSPDVHVLTLPENGGKGRRASATPMRSSWTRTSSRTRPRSRPSSRRPQSGPRT